MAPVIEEEQATWIESGVVSIVAASHNSSLEPSVGLVHGAELSTDRMSLRIFLLEGQSADVISDFRAGRPVSILFTESLICRALQLKANSVQEVPLKNSDGELLKRQEQALANEIARAGMPLAFTFAMLDKRGDNLVAFRLVPEHAFDQSPGPGAGAALGATR